MRYRPFIPSRITAALVQRRSGRPRQGLGATRWLVVAVFVVGGTVQAARAARSQPQSVTLVASPPSGQPVGTMVTWTAQASGVAQPVYQFRIGPLAGPLAVVRDFNTAHTFVWTPLQQGVYQVTVTVTDGFGATSSASATALYVVLARATGTLPVITPLPNPLVALYSAPPCASGLMTVMVRTTTERDWHYTAVQPCRRGQSLNVLVAGLEASTTYEMQGLVLGAWGVTTLPVQLFTTGTLPSTLAFPTVTVPVPPQPGSDPSTGTLVHMVAFTPITQANPLATDLAGHPVWYYDPSGTGLSDASAAVWPVRLLRGGTWLLFAREGLTKYIKDDDVLREIDLAGNTLHEVNLNTVNAQLTARGRRPIRGFHHEALRLPDGDIAVLGYTEACIDADKSDDPLPCASDDRDVVGDAIVVLDPSLQHVVWSWDAFAHLDVSRKAVLGETCGNSPNPARFCPVDNPNAEDWLHSNGLTYSPADGELVLSIRHQDWLIKIDYDHGHGDGRIIWRLGKDGDFTITPADPTNAPYLWFSHQHNPTFLDATTLELFDNGNTRCAVANLCYSRGQVLKLDEQHRTATLVVNANLGVYSIAQGSAERLPTGTYTFGAGTLGTPPAFYSQAIEVPPAVSDRRPAPQLYVQQLDTSEYRSYRVPDLYHGTTLACGPCSAPPVVPPPASAPPALAPPMAPTESPASATAIATATTLTTPTLSVTVTAATTPTVSVTVTAATTLTTPVTPTATATSSASAVNQEMPQRPTEPTTPLTPTMPATAPPTQALTTPTPTVPMPTSSATQTPVLPTATATATALVPPPLPTATATATGAEDVGTATLGETRAESAPDTTSTGFIVGNKVTVGARAAAVTAISVYVGRTVGDPGAQQYSLAIYTDRAGRPGSLLAVSGVGTLTASTWNSLPVSAALAAHTSYWLMYRARGDRSNPTPLYVASASETVGAFGPQDGDDWPAQFAAMAVGPWQYAIYATLYY